MIPLAKLRPAALPAILALAFAFAIPILPMPDSSRARGALANQEREKPEKPESADPGLQVPEPLEPLEFLVGSWKGAEIPLANRLKGRQVKHAWSWRFDSGKIVGVTLRIDDSEILPKAAEIRFDPQSGALRLHPVATRGDGDAKTPEPDLDPAKARVVTVGERGVAISPPGGPDKPGDLWTMRSVAEGVRLVLTVETKAAGNARPRRTHEIGMTREGESFAAAGAAVAGPKCVITGGLANIPVSYKGKTYLVCCTGCADEFNAEPEKWSARADAKAMAAPAQPGDAKPETETPSDTAKPEKAPAPKSAANPAAARALLARAKALDDAGNANGAIAYYQRLVDEHPGTPEAETAARRIKALKP